MDVCLSNRSWQKMVWLLALLTPLPCWFSSSASAQQMPIMRHNAGMEPGMVGSERALMLPRQLRGHFQSVQLLAPRGASISLIEDGHFQNMNDRDVTVGMMIGQVYRLKVTGIPDRAGEEVFPTVEVIDRLYAPQGQESAFAIPVHLSKEDLETALNGGFVTRVVYLEDPRQAVPVRETADNQPVFDVGQREDPLHVADRLGRPMAILRLGSRVPDAVLRDGEQGFTYGSPPLRFYEEPVPTDINEESTITPPNALPIPQETQELIPAPQVQP
jgi:hypothetical protein